MPSPDKSAPAPIAAATPGTPNTFDVKVSQGDVEGVFYTMVYSMVYGGFFGFTAHPVVLLKNGMVFDSGNPPERWRMEGKNLVFIEANGKSVRATEWSKGVPVQSKTFSGSYASMGADVRSAWAATMPS